MKELTYDEILQIRDSIMQAQTGNDAVKRCAELLKKLGFKRE